MKHMMCSGILLPLFSLPPTKPQAKDHGIGDFGPAAYRFADWLVSAGQRFWQVLPLNPTDPFHGNSPYHSRSSFALSPLYVSPELLRRQELVRLADLARQPLFLPGMVDYVRVAAWKRKLLDNAWARSVAHPGSYRMTAYRRFCRRHAYWLDDYALYEVLKQKFGGVAWFDWPSHLRRRSPAVLGELSRAFSKELDRVRFEQYLVFTQWLALKRYCNRLGIAIIGDLPIYVDADSSDVWANQRLFELYEHGRPRFSAGVPPDYFSPTGQLWGNPVYCWSEHRRTRFRWWLRRIRHSLLLYDIVRLDHFRGLVAYWRVPARVATAVHGRWVRAPATELLSAVRSIFPAMPFVAENLGHITPAVERVRRQFGLPGMKVLLFGFGTRRSPHLPAKVTPDTFYYTGTHDNNTVRGWFECDAREIERKNLARFLGHEPDASTVSLELVRACLESRARVVIIPLQDVLALGSEARMNRPATVSGNWQWRLSPGGPSDADARTLLQLTRKTGRHT